MEKLVNFSHELSPAAKAKLEEMLGAPVEERVIPCQIDMESPIKPQLDALVKLAGVDFDLFLPPALSFAAAYVTSRLSYAQSDAMLPVPPAMVVLRREGTPPQFMPCEIVRG